MRGKSVVCSPLSGQWLQAGMICIVLFVNLFVYWGFVYGATTFLGAYSSQSFIREKIGEGLIQGIVYAAYLLMTIPVEIYVRRNGYIKCIGGGLCLFIAGLLAFIPAIRLELSFLFDLILFLTACGLGILVTAMNVFVVLSDIKEGEDPQYHQSLFLNSMGWIIGPLIGSVLLFNGESGIRFDLGYLYKLIGSFVLIIFLSSLFIRFPRVKKGNVPLGLTHTICSNHLCCLKIILAMFSYFVAQSGIFSFFIRYVGDAIPTISYMEALQMMSFGCTVLYVLGRLYGYFAMKILKPVYLLIFLAGGGIIFMLLTIANINIISLCALFLSFFCLSVIFPLILAVGMEQMGVCMKWVSPVFMIGIAGGILSPLLMEFLWRNDMTTSFVVPLVAFVYILFYAVSNRHKAVTS